MPARRVAGDSSVLDVAVAERTKVRLLVSHPTAPGRGTLLLVHGLAGSAESGYMRRTAAAAIRRGWIAARMNLRNCGGTEAMSRTLYNAGQSHDAAGVLAALSAERFPRPYAVIGFSLGGNLVLRYAGASGGNCAADAVAGINPPVDLRRCIDAIERPENRLYHAYFTLKLCAQLSAIRRVRQVPGPDARPWRIGGIRGFDDAFTAPDAGYASSKEYYVDASAGPRLHDIRRPAMILSAGDDPFVPVESFSAYRNSGRLLRLVHPDRGGHCGYWGSGRPRFWAAEAALDFFESECGRG